MSSRVYRYDRSIKPHHYKVFGVMGVILIIVFIIGGALVMDVRSNKSKTVAGKSGSISQVLSDSTNRLVVDEKLFSLELPGDWKENTRVNNDVENSISWLATKKGEDSRGLALYIDRIPPNRIAVNKLLPVKAVGNRLTHGEVSENCASFTGGGTFNVGEAVSKKETPAKWQGVDFICNLPRVVDNETGTGSADGIDTVYVTGATSGKHKYFFVYTDRNVQPKSGVLLDAIESFRAK